MKVQKVLEWFCPYCGKQLISLYEKQLDNMRDVHSLNCQKKRVRGGRT